MCSATIGYLNRMSDSSEPTKRNYVGWITYGIAITLVVVFLWGAVKGSYSEVCQDAATDAGQVVEVCRPLAATDLPVVAFVALVLLILWPGLSEISFGGVKLKRVTEAVEENAKKLDRTMDLVSSININQTFHFGQPAPPPPSSPTVAKALIDGEGDDSAPDASPEATTEFIESWTAVEAINQWSSAVLSAPQWDEDADHIPVVGPSGIGVPSYLADLPLSKHIAAARIIAASTSSYRMEISVARSIRDLLAHGQFLSADAVESATQILRDYESQVRRRIEHL